MMFPNWKCLIAIVMLILCPELDSIMKYATTFRRIEPCPNPIPPYEKPPKVFISLTAYNRTGIFYFKGNLTIKENLKGYFWKIKTGVDRPGGEIRYTNDFKRMTCKSVIPKVMLDATGVQYNEKTCEVYKGNYSFEKIDLHKLDSAYYFPMKELGETVVYFSLYSSRGTSICFISHYVFRVN